MRDKYSIQEELKMHSMDYRLLVDELRKKLGQHPELQANSNEKLRCYDQFASESTKLQKRVCSVVDRMIKAINFFGTDAKIDEMIKTWIDSPVKDFDHEFSTVKKISAAIDDLEDVGEILQLDVEEDFQLEKVTSMQRMEELGKNLKNCLADKDRVEEYANNIRRKESEIWVLLKNERPFGLIEYDTVSRQIREFEGKRGNDIEISDEVAMMIQKQLDVSGDNIEAFVKIGAFHRFLEGWPSVTPIDCNQRGTIIWAWRYPREIIIAENVDGVMNWSRFERESPNLSRRWNSNGWDSSDGSHMSLSDLVDLIFDCPELAKQLSQPITSQTDQKCSVL